MARKTARSTLTIHPRRFGERRSAWSVLGEKLAVVGALGRRRATLLLWSARGPVSAPRRGRRHAGQEEGSREAARQHRPFELFQSAFPGGAVEGDSLGCFLSVWVILHCLR